MDFDLEQSLAANRLEHAFQIRQARLNQLKGHGGGGAPASLPAGLRNLVAGGSGGGGASEQQQQSQAEAAAEARTQLVAQILDPAAADRLARIRLVRPERVAMVEDRLLHMARSGMLHEKITDAQLKKLLESVADSGGPGGGVGGGGGGGGGGRDRIVVTRRGRDWVGEDEDELDDLGGDGLRRVGDDDDDDDDDFSDSRRNGGVRDPPRSGILGKSVRWDKDDDDFD